MRIRATRGDIIVRFYDYAGDEPPRVPELGPFYALTIGKREVRADDKLLAIRTTDMSPWTLTDQVRPGVAGINKADFSVFSLSARDSGRHAAAPAAPATPTPAVASPPTAGPEPFASRSPDPSPTTAEPQPEGPPVEFVERRKVQREIYVARPNPTADGSLTAADVNLILRVDKLKQQELAEQLMVERLRRQQRTSPEVALRAEAPASLPMRFQPPVREREAARHAAAEEDDGASFSARLLALLWSVRLLLVTVLLVAAAVSAYAYLQPKVASNSTPPPLTVAGIGDKVQSAEWSYVVTSAERSPRLGTAQANNGAYLIVHITVTKKNPDVAPLSPSDFLLIDATGARSLPFASTSDVYATSTGLVWAPKYPTNAPVQNHLAFDVHPTAKDLLLFVKPANAQVRLPDP
jgi:hypothetical protein